MRCLVMLLAACGPTAKPPHSCRDPIRPGDLVITEVFAEPAPAAVGKQWFEIYNATAHPIELAGLTITHSRPDGSSAKSHVMTDAMIPSNRYVALGDTPADALPPYVAYSYGDELGGFFKTGKLELRCDGTVLATAGYDHLKRGHSRELTSARPPDDKLADDPKSWCEADSDEFEAGNFGTPGAASDCVPLAIGTCSDGGKTRDVMSAGPGDLVITEVMPEPTKVPHTVGSWFEVAALKDVDVNGLELGRVGARGTPITSASCLHAAAGSFVVFAKSQDPSSNGGLPAVAATFRFALLAGSTARPGDIQISAGKTVIDSVSWTSTTPGASIQLDPSRTDAISNDSETNFCDATVPYGRGDLGTPGAPNLPCPLVPPTGMCNDGGTLRAIVKPTGGQLAITEVMPRPKVKPVQEWFEITNTGSTPFDLNELGLDRATDTRPPDVIHEPECKSVAPGGFALFARSTDPTVNGMLPAVDAAFGFSMVDNSGDVRVLDGSTVLDAATWVTASDGVSLQLRPQRCPAVTPYGDQSNLGTPRAVNACM